MTTYASKTTVSPEKTRVEIEQLLNKYEATAFMYGTTVGRAVLQFEMKGRRYRVCLTLPSQRNYRTKPAHEQALRSLWRSLLLVIKAKLVAVEEGIESLEEAFLANLVLPGNETVGDWLIPQIADAYAEQRMPPLLPAPERGES